MANEGEVAILCTHKKRCRALWDYYVFKTHDVANVCTVCKPDQKFFDARDALSQSLGMTKLSASGV